MKEKRGWKMEVIKGQIRTISESIGTGAKGDWKRWEFQMMDEKKYSTFDAEIGNKFKPGQWVQMEGEKKGQYWNMKTMTVCEPQETAVTIPVQPAASTVVVEDLLRQILAELKRLK